MTQSQINYFLTVAREKSISKASEALFVSQPAVSKQIALLESELGCKLFERHTRGLQLTAAGKSFESLFLEFQLRLKETVEAAKAAESTLSGSYVLGYLEGWLLPDFFQDLSAMFSDKYPLVEFDTSTCSIDQILYALKRGTVNTVLATESILKDYQDLKTVHLCSIGELLLFSSRHPLAGKKDLTLSDFADYTFYATAPQGLSNGVANILHVCEETGFTPNIEHLSSLSSVYNKLQSGTGVFLTNEWIMAKSNPVFRTLKLTHTADVTLGTLRENESHLAKTINSEILNYFRNLK